MSTTRATIDLSILAQEEFTSAEAPGAGTVSERTLKSGGSNRLASQLSSTSTPSLTKPPISQKVTLGGSATVIDLTAVAANALPAAATRTVDMTGKKLVSYLLKADVENSDPITVGPGASSDTYDLFGTGLDQEIGPGRVVASSLVDGAVCDLPAVAAGAKNIEISGTLGDILYLEMLFGEDPA